MFVYCINIMDKSSLLAVNKKIARGERFNTMAPIDPKVLEKQQQDLELEQKLRQQLLNKYKKPDIVSINDFDPIQNNIIKDPNTNSEYPITEVNSITVVSKIIAFMCQIIAGIITGVVEVTPQVIKFFIYLLHFFLKTIAVLMNTTLGQVLLIIIILLMYNTPMGEWFIDTILYKGFKALVGAEKLESFITTISGTYDQIVTFIRNVNSIAPTLETTVSTISAAATNIATTAATTAASTAAFSTMSQAAAQAAAEASAVQLGMIQALLEPIKTMNSNQIELLNGLLLKNEAFVAALPALTNGVADGMGISNILNRMLVNGAAGAAEPVMRMIGNAVIAAATGTGQLMITGGRKKNRTRRFGKHKSARKTKRRLSRVKRHTKRRGTSKKHRSRK